MPRTTAALLSTLLFAAVAAAQFDRERTDQTGYAVYTGITPAAVSNLVSQGLRPIDFEITTVSPLTFDATFVSNTGAYASGFWYYYGLTGAQVSSYLATNQARLIDMAIYDDGSGTAHFAVIMVPNTGSSSRAWWWYYNSTISGLSTAAANNNARIYDFVEYTLGTTTYYGALMLSNTGGDARSWWWYSNASIASISAALSTNGARLIDLHHRANGNYNCVMQVGPGSPVWYWFVGLAVGDVLPTLANYAQRAVMMDTWVDGGGVRRCDLVCIQDADPLAVSIALNMHNHTDGFMGAYLKQINGPVLSAFDENTQFEPASTMKTLHHTHAMRQVYLGTAQLSTPLTTYLNYSPTNASCPIDSNPITEPLQTALDLMMQNSDNRRTQAVAAFFGVANINATAAALGMGNTSLNHRLGCGLDAVANPNRITLTDLGALHQQVANGYLGPWRDTYYNIMLHSVNDLSLAAVIDQEAAAIGGLSPTTVATFKTMTRMAHKGGNYGLTNGGPLWYDRAEFGWLSLPFVVNGSIAPHEFAFGAFVNNASVDANASAALYTYAVPELFRAQVHSALQSWTGALAGVVSVGAGCGPTPLLQSASSLPRINSNAIYTLANGFPTSLALLGIGLSNTSWGSLPLPLNLAPLGGDTGCVALNDIVGRLTAITNASGQASMAVGLPANPALLGLVFYTQIYSLGPTRFRTSNGLRNLIGL